MRVELCDKTDFAVVAVGGWCGDGLDDVSASSAEAPEILIPVLLRLLFTLNITLMFRYAFHTFKVPRFPVLRFPPPVKWSRVFYSPHFPVPRFQRPPCRRRTLYV